MESDIVHSDLLYRAWAWFEKNRKQVIMGTVAAILIGLIIYFIVWQREEKRAEASRALSAAFASEADKPQTNVNAEAYLEVARKHPNTQAARLATLMGASTLFEQGKYEPALAEYQRFSRENPGSPFAAQALVGAGASQEALGKKEQAIEAYSSAVERYPNSPVLTQAKFSLARLLEEKGTLERAFLLYQDVSRDGFGSLAGEARSRVDELKEKHPEIAAKVKPVTPVLSPATNTAPKPAVSK